MENCLIFLVIYLSIVGSANLAVTSEPAFGYNTTVEIVTSTVATQTSSDSTLITTGLTSGTVTSQPPTTTSIQTVTSKVTSISTARNGVSSSTTTTTTSPGPWRDIAVALIAVSGVLLLAFIITVLVLCKMRSKLGQASKTLYPITPEGNEYLDLESGTHKKYKRGAKVELTNITSNTEEEFDSPTFPPTPPVKPKRSVPPPIPSSHPPSVKISDEAPQLPSKPKSKFPPPKTSKENNSSKSAIEQSKLQKSGSKPMIGETNRAFENDATKSGGSNGIANLYDGGDDDMYESYEHGYTGNPATVADDFDDIDIQAPYEDPVESSVGKLIQRQGSSTGLPEMAIQRVSSREQVQDAPLQEEEGDDDEEFDAEGFGNVDPESGLPDMTGMTHIDDLQYFDDPDAMTAQVNETNEDDDDLKNKEHERQDAPSPISDSMDDLLTYDDADMDLGNIDDNQGDDDEPGFYEDFDMGVNTVQPTNVPTKHENNGEDEFELPKVPPRRKSTIDKNKRLVENTIVTDMAPRSESLQEASSDVPDLSGLPSVPLRRDLSTQQSETGSANETFNDMDQTAESPPEINLDTFPGEVAQLRPGKQIEETGNGRPRDSYFLDVMDDNPVEISDNNSNNVLVSGLGGMTGFSEISNGNVHSSEFGENDADFE